MAQFQAAWAGLVRFDPILAGLGLSDSVDTVSSGEKLFQPVWSGFIMSQPIKSGLKQCGLV